MQTFANYFLTGSNRAYRSEIGLYRAERLTAKDCIAVKAPQGATRLYLIAGQRGSVSIAADLGKAWKRFQRIKARALQSFDVE